MRVVQVVDAMGDTRNQVRPRDPPKISTALWCHGTASETGRRICGFRRNCEHGSKNRHKCTPRASVRWSVVALGLRRGGARQCVRRKRTLRLPPHAFCYGAKKTRTETNTGDHLPRAAAAFQTKGPMNMGFERILRFRHIPESLDSNNDERRNEVR